MQGGPGVTTVEGPGSALLGPVVEIWGCQDSGSSRFGVVEIRGCRDLGLSRFEVVEIRGQGPREQIQGPSTVVTPGPPCIDPSYPYSLT